MTIMCKIIICLEAWHANLHARNLHPYKTVPLINPPLLSINQTAEYTPSTNTTTILHFSMPRQPTCMSRLPTQPLYRCVCLVKLLTFVMMLQCSEDLPQELLFSTVSVQTEHTRMIITGKIERSYICVLIWWLTSQVPRCSGTWCQSLCEWVPSA